MCVPGADQVELTDLPPLRLVGMASPRPDEIVDAVETSTQPCFLLFTSRQLTPAECRFVRQTMPVLVVLHEDEKCLSLRLAAAHVLSRPETILHLMDEIERGGRKLQQNQDDLYRAAQEAARAINALLDQRPTD